MTPRIVKDYWEAGVRAVTTYEVPTGDRYDFVKRMTGGHPDVESPAVYERDPTLYVGRVTTHRINDELDRVIVYFEIPDFSI